jgi:hypothetical protein
MTEKQASSEIAQSRERFTNQKRFVATAEHMKQKFGLDGKGFFCGLCGHRFVEGDGVRWVYANGNSPSYCNFFTCDSCDGPDVLERRTAAGNLAKSLEFNEFVLAAKFLRAERDTRERCAQIADDEAKKLERNTDKRPTAVELLTIGTTFRRVAERIRGKE